MGEPDENAPHDSTLPDEAARMGLTPLTAPGLQVASALRSNRPRDRMLAWIGLAAVFLLVVLPIVYAIL